MRSPYGGFSTIVPRGAGGGRCSASPALNSIACATPARSALRCAKSVMRNVTSPAKIGTALACTRALAAATSVAPARPCWSRNGSSRSNAKRRCQPGRDAAGDLRRLDGDRAGAAARVEQRAVLGAAPPAGGGQHRGGQRLLQRRFAGLRVAPAALEQRLARGVDVQRGLVAVEVQHQRQVGLARVDVGPCAGGLAQRVAHRVLDAQRREVQALQRRALRAVVSTRSVCFGVIQSAQRTPRASAYSSSSLR